MVGALAFACSAALQAQTTTPAPTAVLIENVRIFDGKGDALSAPSNVLVVANLINKISIAPIALDPTYQLTIIKGNGRTLMPGLIDAHGHIMNESIGLAEGLSSDIAWVNLVAVVAAEKHLMRGFTTLRDVGGPAFSLKKAIDRGMFPGPRIYPSGATISQTAGHGDFRGVTDVPREAGAPLSYLERNHMTIIADGADQVLLRAREQLREGASQLKMMAGGGVSSNYDPLDVTQGTSAEFRAAVDAAENWGTYVTVHAYTPRAIQIAVNAGVKCIEHGQLIDEPTAKMMADKGIWLSLQPFLLDEDAIPQSPENKKKQETMSRGTDTAYALAKKYKIKTAWGTDTLFSAELAAKQGKQLAKLVRWYTPAEVLRMGTSGNAELLALSGPRNPYQEGRLGVVEVGAYADLLLVNGNPLLDINLIADPAKNFAVIMKDGKVYKNQMQ
jgi:imidazolonepropionase-like amidohydrolase